MQWNNLNYRKSLSLILAFFLTLAVPLSTRANDGDGNAEEWTTVGSAGTVDNGSLGAINLNLGVAEMVGFGTAVVRYNVTATDDLFGGNTTRFVMRFRDNGSCSQVVAVLYRYSLNTGIITPLLTINSNSFAPSGSYQTQFVDSTALPAFDFNNNAYFVEVFLSRSCSGGAPAIGILRLSRF